MSHYVTTAGTIARKGFRRRVIVGVMAFACWAGVSLAADVRPDAANKGVVELETGDSAGVSIPIAEDLAGLIDDGATRRVLPVVGQTAEQNLVDLVLLRGIDMAILQSDVVDAARQQHLLPGIDSSFTYVTKLYNEEFHLLAGPDVKTIADLAHRRVDVGVRGSGTSVTAQRLFDLLKIQIEPVNDAPDIALDKLRHGDIAAVAFVAGKPAALLRNVQPTEGWHLLPVPLDTGVINAYVPTTLTADDYPALIAKDKPVDTIAVGLFLAVAKLRPDSERYKNVSNFVGTFFTQFSVLLEPGHQPKWREINLAAEIPGLTRFPPAQQWLDHNAAAGRQNPQDLKMLFSVFLDTRQQAVGGAPITDQQKQELFNQFQRWQAGQAH